ncbi:MAG: hypothetical protein MUE56_05315 [Ignavibacteria bacterium]|nr:hypothetical protein [Ignavibacteria bacterium]
MKKIKLLPGAVILISFMFLISSCDKKEEQSDLPQNKEQYADKDKELKDREEFLNIREQQLKDWEARLKAADSTLMANGKIDGTQSLDSAKTTDSAKIKEKALKEKKMQEKEKELNKNLDNPKVAIGDYLEYIQRGISDTKTFDANMKKASQVWENRDSESFKKNYKSVKKFIIVEEPKIISQKGGNAVVSVRVKQTNTGNDGKEYEKESTITYNLSADKNGKWKIKSNIVK